MRRAATEAGVSNTTWSRVEAGAADITPAMLQAVASAFGWPADWWERDAPTPPTRQNQEAVEELRTDVAELQDLTLRLTDRLTRLEQVVAAVHGSRAL